jgi:hypothetical protein
MRLGFAEGEQILVLSVSDPLTVFGALLAWEQRMATEIAPLFETPAISPTAVIDDTVLTHDIRIVRNGTDTLLVYGFIDEKTVVIAKSREAFAASVGE